MSNILEVALFTLTAATICVAVARYTSLLTTRRETYIRERWGLLGIALWGISKGFNLGTLTACLIASAVMLWKHPVPAPENQDRPAVESLGPSTSTGCPITSIDYMPSGGNIAPNQSRRLSLTQQANWPSGCEVIWYTGQRSLVRVNSMGRNAVITGVEGAKVGTTAEICAQMVEVRNDKLGIPTSIRKCSILTIR